MTPLQVTPAKLLRIIRELDLGINQGDIYEESQISYLELRRWTGNANEQDVEATVLIRALVRDKLAIFPVADIGAAVLAAIDDQTTAGEAA